MLKLLPNTYIIFYSSIPPKILMDSQIISWTCVWICKIFPLVVFFQKFIRDLLLKFFQKLLRNFWSKFYRSSGGSFEFHRKSPRYSSKTFETLFRKKTLWTGFLESSKKNKFPEYVLRLRSIWWVLSLQTYFCHNQIHHDDESMRWTHYSADKPGWRQNSRWPPVVKIQKKSY